MRGLIGASEGFALLMLSLCVILQTMCSGNNLEVTFGNNCLLSILVIIVYYLFIGNNCLLSIYR